MGALPPPPLLLLLSSLLLAYPPGASAGFKICAFNVQSFNSSKSNNFRVMHTLTRVVSRCDVCLLQEVRDHDGKATKALVAALNRYTDTFTYKSVSSGGLGRTPAEQEQYVYLYRKETVQVAGQYQYPDKKKGEVDVFSREPFVVRFTANTTAIGAFALIPLHSAPSDAVKEIDCLYDVYQEVKAKWSNTDLMFLGDFNAGCAHMTRKNKKDIRLFSKQGFYWLIGDKVDTTVRDTTNCAYDRIVVQGKSFLKAIKPYSARVFNFGKEYRLSKDKVLKLSDHFPVEVELRTKSSGRHQTQTQPLLLLITLSVIVWSSLSSSSSLSL